MPSTGKLPSLTKVEQDPRLFTGFLTVVVIAMYIWALIAKDHLRQPIPLLTLTALLIVHVILHWQIERIISTPKLFLPYCMVQGALAFIISWMVGMEAMVFTLHMALIGEAVGMFGITRRGVSAAVFFLALTVIHLLRLLPPSITAWTLVGIIPILVLTLLYTILYKRQAEAREHAQQLADELESANRQLTEYAARVEDLTIANERQRMARELHDTLSQGLAGLILQLEAADAHLTNQRSEKAKSIIGNAMVQARVTLADARRVIDDLRQPSLDDLDSALRLEVSRFTNATGIPVHFHSDLTRPVPDPVKETVVRAVAEALTNIIHHAQATTANVDVRMKDKSLSVTVADNGIGFDPASIPSGHYGILGMKERVRLVNGSFEIQSAGNKGTTLEIEIPLSGDKG